MLADAVRPSGRGLGGWSLLQDPYGIAEWVTNAHVRAVEGVCRLLCEVAHAARRELCDQATRVISQEDQARQCALRDQLAQLLGRGLVVEWCAGLLEGDLGALFTGHADGQPAV